VKGERKEGKREKGKKKRETGKRKKETGKRKAPLSGIRPESPSNFEKQPEATRNVGVFSLDHSGYAITILPSFHHPIILSSYLHSSLHTSFALHSSLLLSSLLIASIPSFPSTSTST
jgi:hypothetical protein